MPNSVELRQQRARVVESMRAVNEVAEKENRNLNAEEREKFDRHSVDFRDLGERIERAEEIEKVEAEDATSLSEREGGRPDGGGGGGGGGSKEERAAAKRAAFLTVVRRGVSGLAPEQRALVENTAGEILVPEELEAEIIRSLPKDTVMRNICDVKTVQRDRIRRRFLGEVTVGWGKLETDEQTLTDSMPSTPTEEFTYVEDLYGLAKIGEDEFDDTDVNLEAYVKDSFSRAMGEAEDTAYAVGTGHAAHQPLGVFAAGTGIPTVAAAANNAVSFDDILKLIYSVPAGPRKRSSFLLPSTTELHLSQKKDNDGQYIWKQSLLAAEPNTIKGYPVYNQEDIAAIAASKKVAAFGDFKTGYRIYDRLGMTLQRLVELYSEEGMVGFKVRRRTTGDVIRPDVLRILATPA